MTAPTLTDLTHSPELTALAPLLYVAWADGELDPEELAAVRATQADHLDAEQRDALARWTNPDTPPTSTELLRLFRTIRTELGQLGAASRQNLVDAGLTLANRLHDEAARDSTRRALAEVEAALGVHGSEVARELFPERPPVAQTFKEAPPSFDHEAMTRLLDGDYREDWEQVRTLLADETFRYAYDEPKSATRERVLAWTKRLADEGYGALSFPESVGGGGRTDRFIKAFEALGMFDLSLVVKFGVQFGLFGGAILNLGTEKHHRAYLADVGSARLLGGFAMTELGHGSNVRELETVARWDPERDAFVLHTPSRSARKEWIGNAALHGRTMVVFAQLEVQGVGHGVHAFVVPVRDDEGRTLPGVRIADCGDKMGLDGVDNGRIWFDHVEVPRDNLLDRYGRVTDAGEYDSPIASASRRFFTMLGTLVGGRISVGAAAVTASKSALTIAIRYGALRRQFGAEPTDGGAPTERAILDYPSHQRRLIPKLAETYALHFASADLQRRFHEHEGEDTRAIETLAAAMKVLMTWHAIDSVQAARECCGGMGFLSENRIGEIRKDVDVFATFEGDNTVLLNLVAKGLLTDYARSLSNHLVGTLLKQIGRQAAAAARHQNPLSNRRTDSDHLRDPAFHEGVFAFRTESLLVSAARRVKKRTDRGMSPFDAVMDVQTHLVDLAKAHAEAHVHACFAHKVDALPEGPERAALAALCSLYALSRLDADMAWFQENNFVAGAKARAIRREVGTLCQEVRNDAVAYVDAFAIPETALAAPIAFEGYVDRLSPEPEGA
ncbi:MAG: acyl-CoA dehydrogenase [Sandaracinaceae bacterium]